MSIGSNAVWIVDDDRSIRWVLEKALARENIPCLSFASADAAIARLEEGSAPSVLLSDIRMPGHSGLDLLHIAKTYDAALPIIIMTAYSDLESAVAAFQGGAFEYLPKPFDVDQALALVHRAIAHRAQAAPSAAGEALATLTPEILGQAPAMQDLFRAIGRLSHSHATVLINGESGTGKELVARALHRHGPRRSGPFIALNSAAIPRELLESELFGHEKNAFTGANTQRIGRFEEAAGGTLFLDEIGDMPIDLQTRLLRVLSDGHFYRVGGHHALRADVRIITATHQNLEQRVKDGLFREDLFHRLNVIRLRLPPLRERREDIAALAAHFLANSAQQLGVARKQLSAAVLDFMQNAPWPGNVRQLENFCHWLTVMAPGQQIEMSDLPNEQKNNDRPDSTAPAANWSSALAQAIDQHLAEHPGTTWEALTQIFETTLIRRALAASGGRRSDAAQLLGIGRNTIARKIQELGLETHLPHPHLSHKED
ncbi:nitrogen regulation protein NR(I) [Azonexus sp.]|uniref:nitrogen regulation protein NR(I) n=1 Tax=Azonexus sp. TaxID=1872668 RepID=UPI0039E48A67